MAQWINPLDKLPQVRQDYANHIIYGSFAVILILLGLHPMWATLALVGANGAKKIVDYFKENESLSMCIAKTLVGGIWGATVWVTIVFKG
jgi:hypothetical protein